MESHLLQMRGLKQIKKNNCTILRSHLLQMRGLKHFSLDREHHRHKVASFTDAWIETKRNMVTKKQILSHLLQMRGLKQGAISCANLTYVASFTDAWIET